MQASHIMNAISMGTATAYGRSCMHHPSVVRSLPLREDSSPTEVRDAVAWSHPRSVTCTAHSSCCRMRLASTRARLRGENIEGPHGKTKLRRVQE